MCFSGTYKWGPQGAYVEDLFGTSLILVPAQLLWPLEDGQICVLDISKDLAEFNLVAWARVFSLGREVYWRDGEMEPFYQLSLKDKLGIIQAFSVFADWPLFPGKGWKTTKELVKGFVEEILAISDF